MLNEPRGTLGLFETPRPERVRVEQSSSDWAALRISRWPADGCLLDTGELAALWPTSRQLSPLIPVLVTFLTMRLAFDDRVPVHSPPSMPVSRGESYVNRNLVDQSINHRVSQASSPQ